MAAASRRFRKKGLRAKALVRMSGIPGKEKGLMGLRSKFGAGS